jgi:hypothetical protein
MKGEKKMKETRTEEILAEREKTYGSYAAVAATAQKIKFALHAGTQHNNTSDVQHESLDMIANKLARIVNGDSDYEDSWEDIAGYAMLTVRDIQGRKLGPF